MTCTSSICGGEISDPRFEPRMTLTVVATKGVEASRMVPTDGGIFHTLICIYRTPSKYLRLGQMLGINQLVGWLEMSENRE